MSRCLIFLRHDVFIGISGFRGIELRNVIGDRFPYLTFIADEVFWVIVCVYVNEIPSPGGVHTEYPNKITLPRAFANQLGNVFVPNGNPVRNQCCLWRRLK